jgi:hypothetical protein
MARLSALAVENIQSVDFDCLRQHRFFSSWMID